MHILQHTHFYEINNVMNPEAILWKNKGPFENGPE